MLVSGAIRRPLDDHRPSSNCSSLSGAESAGVSWTHPAHDGGPAAQRRLFRRRWRASASAGLPKRRRRSAADGDAGGEEALREIEERYRLLLDGIKDPRYLLIDPQGRVASWNAGAERIKGYKAADIIGRNYSRFFPPISSGGGRGDPAPDRRQRRHEEQGMRSRKDGSRFFAAWFHGAARFSGNRGVLRVQSRSQREQGGGAKYGGCWKQRPTRWWSWTRARHRPPHLRRRSIRLQPRRAGRPASQDIIPRARGAADRRRDPDRGGGAAQQIGTGIELSGLRKDGARSIEIMLARCRAPRASGDRGDPRHRVRKEAERTLAQMEAGIGTVARAPDPMILLNQPTDSLVNLHAERVFGYGRDELVGLSARALVSEESVVRLVAYTQRFADGRFAEAGRTAIELDGCHKDGNRFPIEVT